MTSTFTANKALELPANGDYVDTWNVPINGDFSIVDKALGGNITLNATELSGVINLTSTQYQNLYIIVTGTLTANVMYQLPAGVGGQWIVYNGTTGAYTVTFSSAGGGSSVAISQNNRNLIASDGTNVVLSITNIGGSVGDIKATAATSAPSGWMLCYGQAVSRTVYAALFAALGTAWGTGDGSTTFNVPDLRGRVLAGLDNMGGSNANRMSTVMASSTLGAVGGDQNLQYHTHGATDSGHSHVASDSGHTHAYQNPQANTSRNTSFGGGFGVAVDNTGVGFANITVGTGYANITVSGNGAGNSQNIQPTAMINYVIYAGI